MRSNINDLEKKISGIISFLETHFSKIRVRGLNPVVFEDMEISLFGYSVKMKKIATISVQRGNAIVIKAWDIKNVGSIEKAIMTSNLGVSPLKGKDGEIFIDNPVLTSEKRKELVKICSQYAEKAKISIRSTRRDFLKKLKQEKEKGLYSEDEEKAAIQKVDNIISEAIQKIQVSLKQKTKEIVG